MTDATEYTPGPTPEVRQCAHTEGRLRCGRPHGHGGIHFLNPLPTDEVPNYSSTAHIIDKISRLETIIKSHAQAIDDLVGGVSEACKAGTDLEERVAAIERAENCAGCVEALATENWRELYEAKRDEVELAHVALDEGGVAGSDGDGTDIPLIERINALVCDRVSLKATVDTLRRQLDQADHSSLEELSKVAAERDTLRKQLVEDNQRRDFVDRTYAALDAAGADKDVPVQDRIASLAAQRDSARINLAEVLTQRSKAFEERDSARREAEEARAERDRFADLLHHYVEARQQWSLDCDCSCDACIVLESNIQPVPMTSPSTRTPKAVSP